MASERELAKTWTSIPVIDLVCQRMNVLTIWCTPTRGLFVAAARVFAAFEHTLKQPGIPRGGGGLVPLEIDWQETTYLGLLCTQYHQYYSVSCLHPGVPSLLPQASETRVRSEPQSHACVISCHMSLMSPNGMHRVYSPESLMTVG